MERTQRERQRSFGTVGASCIAVPGAFSSACSCRARVHRLALSELEGDAHSHCHDVGYGSFTGRLVGQRTGHKTYDPWVGDVGLSPVANTYNYNTY